MQNQTENKSILAGVVRQRAVLYARVSGDDRKYATSGIEGQLNDCRKHAQDNGYNIVAEYFEEPDIQTSGYVWLPELEKILKLAAQNAFDVLVVRELDRLARNRFKQMSVENRLSDLGIEVEYVIGQYDNTPEGRMLKGLMGEFAEYERGKIMERTRRGRRKALEAGKVFGSQATYGYDIDARSFVVNEAEAGVVRLIFELYVIKQLAIPTIADYLDNRNIPKPAKRACHKATTDKEKQRGWSWGTIHNLIENETYIGNLYYGKTTSTKDRNGKRKRIKLPKNQWVKIDVPAIISDELFEAAQKRRDSHKKRGQSNAKHNYLFSGRSTCGHCGNGFSGLTKTQGGNQWSYYKCNAAHLPKRYGFKCENSLMYPVEAVEAAGWEWIKSILLDPANLEKELEAYRQTQQTEHQPTLSMIEANKKKLAQLDKQKDRLITAYKEGVLTLDEVAGPKTELDKQRAGLLNAIDALKDDLPETLDDSRIATIKEFAAKVAQGVDVADNDFDLRREIMELLDVSAVFRLRGDEKWIKISCVLGENEWATDYTTTLFTVRKSAK